MTTIGNLAKGLVGAFGTFTSWAFSHVRLLIEYALIAAVVALAGLYVAQRIHGLQLDAQVQKLAGDAQLADGTIKVLAQANVDQDQAIASLKDPDYVAKTRARIVAEREKLLALLREMKLPYAESQTNFVFFKTGRPHTEVQAAMRAQGVGIARAFPPMLDWARITIGLPEENELAREALRKVLG